ncbi:MAG: aminoacyl-tRNA hydrolase [Cyanothece sp. SIO1E1]|nr:aminoacyl-tRNA hydrolase [Cyanothece sp. SIO1E1]
MANVSEPVDLVIPRLIVGLGNPGAKYDGTRHNFGFDAIDALSRVWQVNLSTHRKFQALFGEAYPTQRHKVGLLKPMTYMNRSGQAVRAVTDWFKVSPESVLVIYDDMDLPIGKIRLRLSGSAGGHNGMKSIISHLGSQNFPRLRIGIGSPATQLTSSKDTISHVLGRLSQAENKIMAEVLAMVVEAVELSLKQGVEKSMSLYNGRTIVGIEH